MTDKEMCCEPDWTMDKGYVHADWCEGDDVVAFTADVLKHEKEG